MNNWIMILTGVLGVQLVLAVAVNLAGEDYGAFEPEQELLVFDKNTVDGLRIQDGKQALTLKKRDGKWLLPESSDFPASQSNVEGLLNKLAGLKKGWPVATTSGAVRRFKVSGGEFERKIALLSGEQVLTELYVGTSPGFRKVHLRPANEDAVFAAAFNTWEAKAEADDWIDKDILKLDETDITRIEMPGIVIEWDEEAFKVSDLGDEQETNAQEVKALVGKLTALRVQSLLGTEDLPEYRQDDPTLEIRIGRKGGEDLVYRFSKPKDTSHYVLKRSDLGHYFKVAAFSADAINETKRDQLIRDKSGEAENQTTGNQPSGVITNKAE